MNPPARGLAEFARRLGFDPPIQQERDLRGPMRAIVRDNERAIEALVSTAERIPTTLVVGNHDRHLGDPCAREVLEELGLGELQVAPCVRAPLGGTTAMLCHGHEWDEGNAAAFGSGEVMTRIIYRAVIPFLLAHGARRHVRMNADRVAALRPEEAVVPMLRRWLEPRTFEHFFEAFLELLAVNGYLPRPAAWLRKMISPDRVRRRIHEQDLLWDRMAKRALRALAGQAPLPHGVAAADVLVMGHAHVLDWAVQRTRGRDQLYVNLGTWTERASDALSPLDTTLPALRLDVAGSQVQVSFVDLVTGAEMQRFTALAPAPRPLPLPPGVSA